MDMIEIFCLLAIVLQCDGLSLIDQLDHIARRKAESYNGIPKTRRSGMYGNSVILGSPVYPYQLPKAEPVLPGHTLIRPSLGMLKSAVKFPHKELENGAGVYGHIDNLGIKYDGKQHRVLYSGFRRAVPGKLNRLQRMQNYNLLLKNKARSYDDTSDERKPIYYYFTRYDNNLDRNKKTQQNRNDEDSKSEHTSLNDFSKLVQPNRREDVEQRQDIAKPPKKYVRGNVGLGSFVNIEYSSHEGVANKTKMFWDTKDFFDHIKVNPDAPEHTDLLPTESYDYAKNWWFYHQSDFEEFKDR